MSENGKHMNRYTSSDIQKYVEGKLSAQEMHEMEKAALDDPFLADAIEGFGYISSTQSEATIKKDTEELHQRLHGRVSGKKKSSSVAFIRLKIAAVAIIILGIAGLTFNSILNKSLPKENVARFKPSNNVSDSVIQHDKATTIQTQKDSETAGNIDSSMQPASAKPKKERSRKASAKNATDKEIQETMEEPEPEIRKKGIASFKKENADMAKSGEPGFRLDSIKTKPTAALEPGEALQGKVAGVEISHNRLKTLNRNFISGRVVDANNQPVAGASVFSKNKKTAALTNNDGIFKLNNSNNNPTIDVQVNSIGFQPATATLSNNYPDNIIKLQPSASSLSEVVVSGYGLVQKKDMANDDDNEFENAMADSLPRKAIPLTGWENFWKYIGRNKKISATDSTINGEEIFSFSIDSTGKLSSFRIINSLSPSHDKEVIRLIQNGPKWQLLDGKKARIKLTINF